MQNYPNPFNNNTVISFYLSSPSEIRLDIYDIKGSLIKSLFNGIKPTGISHLSWDGRTNACAESSSGVYFVRMVIEGKNNTTLNRKIVLVK